MNDVTSDDNDPEKDKAKSSAMDSNSSPERRSKPNAGLGRDVQAKIGQQLRAYYDGLLEPTPDKFADLLRQLEAKNSGGEGSA